MLIKFPMVKPGQIFHYNGQDWVKTETNSAGSIVYNCKTTDKLYGDEIIDFVPDYKMVRIEV